MPLASGDHSPGPRRGDAQTRAAETASSLDNQTAAKTGYGRKLRRVLEGFRQLIVDASAVVAAIFPEQNRHDECARTLNEIDRRILSPFVVAEIDYFILQYGGVAIELFSKRSQ